MFASGKKIPHDYFVLFMMEVLRYPLHIVMHTDCPGDLRDKINDEMHKWWFTLLDLYEDKGVDSDTIIQFCNWSLLYSCKAIGIDIPNNIELGTFPINTINVHCTFKNNTYVILVDRGLINIIKQSATIISENILENESKAIGAISALINIYVEKREVVDLLDYMDKDYYQSSSRNLGIALTVHTIYFVLLHEYGHIVNNHLEAVKIARIDGNDYNQEFFYKLGELNIPVLYKRIKDEYEADIWSMYILLRLSELSEEREKQNIEAALSAPVMFLGLIMSIESGDRFKGNPIDTHPPSFDRLSVNDTVCEFLNMNCSSSYRSGIGMTMIRIHNLLYKHANICMVFDSEYYKTIILF